MIIKIGLKLIFQDVYLNKNYIKREVNIIYFISLSVSVYFFRYELSYLTKNFLLALSFELL